MKKLRIIVGCEFSQIVTSAFLERGHDAYSCDIIPCEGDYPERHYQMDILELLKKESFDLGIFHPPCTYLSHAANRALKEQNGRKELQKKAVEFFMALYNAPITKVCVENPRGWMTQFFRREDQVIEPFEFGEPERKRTCLWLKNLPPLMKTLLNPLGMMPKKVIKRRTGQRAGGNYGYYYVQGKTAKEKSKTFSLIAKAMATQWS